MEIKSTKNQVQNITLDTLNATPNSAADYWPKGEKDQLKTQSENRCLKHKGKILLSVLVFPIIIELFASS